MNHGTSYAGIPCRGTYRAGRGEPYLGIRPPSMYGSPYQPHSEPKIPYSNAVFFYGSSQDRKRGERLEEELLLALALYGFGGVDLHPHRKNEDEEDDFKLRRLRQYNPHLLQDFLSSSYRSDDSIPRRTKESDLEKKAKDRKNGGSSRTSASLSYQL